MKIIGGIQGYWFLVMNIKYNVSLINVLQIKFRVVIRSTSKGFKFGLENSKGFRRPQCDPIIIEMTIGFVLGPSSALYIPFLMRCTLTKR